MTHRQHAALAGLFDAYMKNTGRNRESLGIAIDKILEAMFINVKEERHESRRSP